MPNKLLQKFRKTSVYFQNCTIL